MVSLETYRDIVQQILTEYSTHQPAYGDVEMELILIVSAIAINWYALAGTKNAASIVR
jgi:hypothetical protein